MDLQAKLGILADGKCRPSSLFKEMPVRYWKNMPETQLIPSLLQEAPQRVVEMLRHRDFF